MWALVGFVCGAVTGLTVFGAMELAGLRRRRRGASARLERIERRRGSVLERRRKRAELDREAGGGV